MGSRAPGKVDIPFKLMTSRIVDDLEPDERWDKEVIEKLVGNGWSAWSSRNGLLVERRGSEESTTLLVVVYS